MKFKEVKTSVKMFEGVGTSVHKVLTQSTNAKYLHKVLTQSTLRENVITLQWDLLQKCSFNIPCYSQFLEHLGTTAYVQVHLCSTS